MKWLSLAQALGLTNLSDEDVRKYEGNVYRVFSVLSSYNIEINTQTENLSTRSNITINQILIVISAEITGVFSAFNVFVIGFVIAFIVNYWHLTFGRLAAVLIASSVGALFGSIFYGWLADKIGQRSVIIATLLNISIATGAMALTPDYGWVYLMLWRLFIGFGATGLNAANNALVMEFVPWFERPWTTRLFLTISPAGFLLGALLGAYAAPLIGWRGLFAVGLLPAFWAIYIRVLVPESPRWLIRKGRAVQARQSLVRVLRVTPPEIELQARLSQTEKTKFIELFSDWRRITASGLIGLTQIGRFTLALWMVTLFVMVLHVSPKYASQLAIWAGLAAILGRLFFAWLSDALGMAVTGMLFCMISAILISLAGFLNYIYVGGVSLFVFLIVLQSFCGSGSHSTDWRFIAQLWPTRLRSSGMSFAYRVSTLGEIIGSAGLALIAGSSNYVTPTATIAALTPGFEYLAVWYVFASFAFWLGGLQLQVTRGARETNGSVSKLLFDLFHGRT